MGVHINPSNSLVGASIARPHRRHLRIRRNPMWKRNAVRRGRPTPQGGLSCRFAAIHLLAALTRIPQHPNPSLQNQSAHWLWQSATPAMQGIAPHTAAKRERIPTVAFLPRNDAEVRNSTRLPLWGSWQKSALRNRFLTERVIRPLRPFRGTSPRGRGKEYVKFCIHRKGAMKI